MIIAAYAPRGRSQEFSANVFEEFSNEVHSRLSYFFNKDIELDTLYLAWNDLLYTGRTQLLNITLNFCTKAVNNEICSDHSPRQFPRRN